MCGLSVSYFNECRKALNDRAFQRKRGIPDERLRSLPLHGWYRQPGGKLIVIKERDLISQINP
jgi:hypothetical protein